MYGKRSFTEIDDSIPLVGCIAFGCIDRGTNIIQVRPISTCPLSCLFCSTDAGPNSRIRQTEYVVVLDHLVDWIDKIVDFKGRRGIEAHIDTVGDPLTYPHLVELVARVKQIRGVEVVSIQTHGSLLNERILDDLSSAGLDRVNLSIDALNPQLAKKLANTSWYDVEKVMEMAEYIVENTRMDLLIAPVWVPAVNDGELPRIIEFALKIGAGKRFPPLGIQKYEVHKHGRKVRGVKSMSWWSFYRRLREWEKIYRVKLILHPYDFGIHKRPMLPVSYKKFERVTLRVVAPGWLKSEKLAVTSSGDRVMSLINADNIPIGAKVRARVLVNKHNIYIAEAI